VKIDLMLMAEYFDFIFVRYIIL